MPEIVFKGKEYVYNHHLTVPYRPLVVHADKGVGAPDLAGNLVIHGDNLAALKSLLPRYAGKVDLVFIDPPYNTGNEGWCYSDRVNSPIMKEWLSTNPVDADDLLRHDKWLCMMWPRLTLLRELLSDSGSIWMTLDDNEVHRARMVMDEVFGETNHIASVAWANKVSPANDARLFSRDHDTVMGYAKELSTWSPNRLERSGDQEALYQNPDGDSRGPWNSLTLTSNKSGEERPNLYFAIPHPRFAHPVWPPEGCTWRFTQENVAALSADHRLYWGVDGTARMPRLKRFLRDMSGVVPRDVWSYERFGSTQSANLELQAMGLRFPTPKPTALLDGLVSLATDPDALVLDSFAGSGTTAHAVLKANAKDGGSRRFILVEGEDYADTLTAERVRRAINGYAWVGTQRETLLEQKITLTQLKKADTLLKQIDAIKAREGLLAEGAGDLADQASTAVRRFDRIEAKVDDGVLRVEGLRKVSERAPGLGGSFTYCTLGEPLSLEKMLSGERLPAWGELGEWLFHTATGGALPPRPADAPEWYLGRAQDRHVWLVYRDELAFLKSPQAALTLSLAERMAAWGRSATQPPLRHLVFAPAKYLSNRQLQALGLDFAALPFALYREG